MAKPKYQVVIRRSFAEGWQIVLTTHSYSDAISVLWLYDDNPVHDVCIRKLR